MQGPQHGAVSGELPDLGDVFQNLGLADLGQHLFAEELRHLLHLVGNGGVIRAEIRVALAGLHDDQTVILGTEVKVDLLHHRIRRLQEIDGDQAAHRAGHLVQQAGSLGPVFVLRKLSNVSVGHGVHAALVEKGIQNGAEKHLKGSGGADARGADHVACDIRVESAHRIAGLLKSL